jgi:flagellar protein FlgJ
MTAIGPQRHALGRAARPDADATPEQKLRGTAQQLQSVFVEQLFKAMRATVPEDGMFSGGQGEEVFRGLLDQQVAELVPDQWQGQHSLGETLYRQLARALPAASQSAAAPAQEKP